MSPFELNALDACLENERGFEDMLNSWGSLNLWFLKGNTFHWFSSNVCEKEEEVRYDLDKIAKVVVDVRTGRDLLSATSTASTMGYNDFSKKYTFRNVLYRIAKYGAFNALRLVFLKNKKTAFQVILTKSQTCQQEYATEDFDELRVKLFSEGDKVDLYKDS